MTPIIQENFADNGQHSHWSVVDSETGTVIIEDIFFKELIDEAVFLLNQEGMMSDILKLFRREFKLVNRDVCHNCGLITSKISISDGCERCGFVGWNTIVIKEDK